MRIIQKIKSGLGYTWAALCLVLVLATFIGLGFWEHTLAKETGIHVSPRFSGGEIRQTIDHGAYKAMLHRMVFDGLLSERAEGFVQIDWVPAEGRSLPPLVEDEFDIDGDGAIDFAVRLDTPAGSVHLARKQPWILDPEPLIYAGSERIARIRLRNPVKK